ncbi:Endoribonuclease L-PSP/chorismate mutase-like protein [Plectosphaerella plurivora]|uniref:Endoribonuclease L-PSP/chorismate mutase-like protein n=1 Tax=Plectosphaerella plurivora TaxID=936078 RepID=A0A9P9A7U0_9PEZI|nr:Endoribonuclease L-PSP/chorismate mutase-like protein [Plectosphaerella plurivora]
MTSLTFNNPSGGIKEFAESSYYSQSVDMGNGTVKTSGQGGWSIEGGPLGGIPNDARAQVDAAFANLDHVLKAAGLGLGDVYLVRSYHMDIDETMGMVSEAMRRLIPKHRPIWTAVGVTRLGHPDMKIEIEVEARRA